MRGGIEVSATLLTVGVQPSIAFTFKSGFQVGGELALVLYPTVICIDAFVDVIWILFCDCGFIMLPCGLDWTRLLELELFCITIPTGGEEIKWIVLATDGDEDLTPPTVGTVTAEQVLTDTARAKFSGFIEEESNVLNVQLTFGKPFGSSILAENGDFFFELLLTYLLYPYTLLI